MRVFASLLAASLALAAPALVRFPQKWEPVLRPGSAPANMSGPFSEPLPDHRQLENGPAAPRRVASLNLCTDELLLALAAPEQIMSVTHLAQDPAETPLWRQARRYRCGEDGGARPQRRASCVAPPVQR